MKKTILTALTIIGAAFYANSESIAFIEDFNSDYSANFPTKIDACGGLPNPAIQTLFIGLNGAFEAWWHLKDSNSSTDRYIASHSFYNTPAKSSSWLCSRPISIPTEGFVLSFGAQSYECIQQHDYGQGLSDLWVYVTETLPARQSLPAAEDATMHIEQVPVGKSDTDVASDFTFYTLDLDQWAGKEVFICFANLNEDKGILALDDIKVARADRAELEVIHPAAMSVDPEYNVSVTIQPLQNLESWTLSFTDGNTSLSHSGDAIEAGKPVTYVFNAPIEKGQTLDYTVTLTASSQDDIVVNGSVSRLSFAPFRRVLVEEITGQWCGNCPLGAYNIESMLEDKEMKEYVVPVAVHINSGGNDWMVCSDYANALGVTAAPMFRLNRENRYIGLGNHDYVFNPDNELSLAWQVKQHHLAPTFLEISLEGQLNAEKNAFDMTATVTSALPIDNNRYSIGWVLTENNVGVENARMWYQTNYFSGISLDGNLGGWTLLPEHASGVKWHDVARGVWDIIGAPGVLPAHLDMDIPYSVNKSLTIPTVEYSTINPDYCMVIAYIVDMEEMEIMNVVSLPMSDVANQRITIEDVLGISDVKADSDEAPIEYYNLNGIKLATPHGICIERQGSDSRIVNIK